MKIFYRISFCLSVVFLTTGCSGQLSFDELTKDIPTNIDTRAYSSDSMNYSIFQLRLMDLIDKDYSDTLNVEMFVDTSMVFEEGTNILTVIEFSSSETKLEEAWKKFISNRLLIEDFRIYSEGITDFLSMPAYYEHSVCTISKKNIETINFLFRSDSLSLYFLSIQVPTDKDYPKNMEKLLYSAKTFTITK